MSSQPNLIYPTDGSYSSSTGYSFQSGGNLVLPYSSDPAYALAFNYFNSSNQSVGPIDTNGIFSGKIRVFIYYNGVIDSSVEVNINIFDNRIPSININNYYPTTLPNHNFQISTQSYANLKYYQNLIEVTPDFSTLGSRSYEIRAINNNTPSIFSTQTLNINVVNPPPINFTPPLIFNNITSSTFTTDINSIILYFNNSGVITNLSSLTRNDTVKAIDNRYPNIENSVLISSLLSPNLIFPTDGTYSSSTGYTIELNGNIILPTDPEYILSFTYFNTTTNSLSNYPPQTYNLFSGKMIIEAQNIYTGAISQPIIEIPLNIVDTSLPSINIGNYFSMTTPNHNFLITTDADAILYYYQNGNQVTPDFSSLGIRSYEIRAVRNNSVRSQILNINVVDPPPINFTPPLILSNITSSTFTTDINSTILYYDFMGVLINNLSLLTRNDYVRAINTSNTNIVNSVLISSILSPTITLQNRVNTTVTPSYNVNTYPDIDYKINSNYEYVLKDSTWHEPGFSTDIGNTISASFIDPITNSIVTYNNNDSFSNITKVVRDISITYTAVNGFNPSISSTFTRNLKIIENITLIGGLDFHLDQYTNFVEPGFTNPSSLKVISSDLINGSIKYFILTNNITTILTTRSITFDPINLYIIGPQNIILNAGASYNDIGLNINNYTSKFKNIATNVITNTLNTSSPGNYEQIYIINGNDTISRNISIVTGAVGTIDLQGLTTVYVKPGQLNINNIPIYSNNSNQASVSSNPTFDTNAPGTYVLTFTELNSNPVNATVVISLKPHITLNGNANITIPYGSTYNDLGADSNDGSTVITNNPVTNLPGNYTITYNASDGTYNADTVYRYVTVSSGPQTVISLIGLPTVYLELKTGYYMEEYASVNDGSTLVTTYSSPITNTNITSFTVYYNAGNATQVTRTVIVRDTSNTSNTMKIINGVTNITNGYLIFKNI